MMITVLMLYLSFRLKQFLCDFVFQTGWMANNKGMVGVLGYKALLTHTSVHAIGTVCVALIFAPGLWWLGVVDLLLHGFIDRVKGRIVDSQQWGVNKHAFWIAFGLDQEAHNLTHMVYILVMADYMHLIEMPFV